MARILRQTMPFRKDFHLTIISLNALIVLINGAVVQVSNPFDPYRLECPRKFAIIKITMQQVESIGGARNDTMIASFCENTAKLYPSSRDDISPPDDEDCRWTQPVKIPGENFGFKDLCTNREFIAGISRQEMLQYGFLCCKLKDRRRKKCFANRYTMPSLNDPSMSIERNQFLLSSFAFQDGHLIAQFCDFVVMNQDEIDAEVIKESKTKLATWFASRKRPSSDGDNSLNGQSSSFPGSPDRTIEALPVLVPRDKNEFLIPRFRTTKIQSVNHTATTLPTIKLDKIKPKQPIKYSLSPEEEAVFRTTDPNAATDSEDLEADGPTTPFLLPVLRQRASLSAILNKGTTKRKSRIDFRTSPTPTTDLTTVDVENSTDDAEGGIDEDQALSDQPPVEKQRHSLAKLLNSRLSTKRTTTRKPTTETAQTELANTTISDVGDEIEQEDSENSPDTLAPNNALARQRVTVSALLNKIDTAKLTTKRNTSRISTTTTNPTPSADEEPSEEPVNEEEPTTPSNNLQKQRVSLSNFLSKTKNKTRTTPATITEEVPVTNATEEANINEGVGAEEDNNQVTEASDVVAQQRSSLAFLLRKNSKKTTSKLGVTKSFSTEPTSTAELESEVNATATAESDANNEDIEDADKGTDDVGRQRSSLSEVLQKIAPAKGKKKTIVSQSEESDTTEVANVTSSTRLKATKSVGKQNKNVKSSSKGTPTPKPAKGKTKKPSVDNAAVNATTEKTPILIKVKGGKPSSDSKIFIVVEDPDDQVTKSRTPSTTTTEELPTDVIEITEGSIDVGSDYDVFPKDQSLSTIHDKITTKRATTQQKLTTSTSRRPSTTQIPETTLSSSRESTSGNSDVGSDNAATASSQETLLISGQNVAQVKARNKLVVQSASLARQRITDGKTTSSVFDTVEEESTKPTDSFSAEKSNSLFTPIITATASSETSKGRTSKVKLTISTSTSQTETEEVSISSTTIQPETDNINPADKTELIEVAQTGTTPQPEELIASTIDESLASTDHSDNPIVSTAAVELEKGNQQTFLLEVDPADKESGKKQTRDPTEFYYYYNFDGPTEGPEINDSTIGTSSESTSGTSELVTQPNVVKSTSINVEPTLTNNVEPTLSNIVEPTSTIIKVPITTANFIIESPDTNDLSQPQLSKLVPSTVNNLTPTDASAVAKNVTLTSVNHLVISTTAAPVGSVRLLSSKIEIAAAHPEGKILCNTTLAATTHTGGLVIACGKGAEVWVPSRCPLQTFCMESSDTSYRICCPAFFISKV